MRNLLKRTAAWPKRIPELSVMEIYNALESRYDPPQLANVPVLLVRATLGVGIDTPYRDVYQDEDFGWLRVADKLTIVDVSGGHSSMLQGQAVESLARMLAEKMGAGTTPYFSQ